MSEDLNVPTTGHDEAQEELLLDAEEQAALQAGFQSLPTPKPQPGFNSRLLATMMSGRDFSPWRQQAAQRIRWMLLPTALGVIVGFGILRWSPRPQKAPAPEMIANLEKQGSDLPLPTEILLATMDTLPKDWRPPQDTTPVKTPPGRQNPPTGMGVTTQGPSALSPGKASASMSAGSAVTSPAGNQERRQSRP